MNTTTRNVLIVLCLVALVLIGGYIILNPALRTGVVTTTTSSTTSSQTNTQTPTTPVTPTPVTPKPTGPDYEPYTAILVGQYLCLPHTNTSGPQTLECALGMKTDDGTYFAVDLNQVPQVQSQLATGDRFTARGTVTPVQRLNTDQWKKYPITGIFTVKDSFRKIPTSVPTSATLRASIGQSVTGLSVTLTPLEVIDDSRCPQGVNCIWAGTVHVRTKVQNEVGTSDVTFELGKSVTLGDEVIALTNVTPAKTQSSIATSSYQFTYEVSKR